MCVCYRKEFCSSLDLPLLLQEPLLVSRTQDSIATSSPSSYCSTHHVFWKLVFVFPSWNKLTERESGIVEWLHYKLEFELERNHRETVHTSLSPFAATVKPQVLSVTSTHFLSTRRAGTNTHSPPVNGGRGNATTITTGEKRQLCVAVKGVCAELLCKEADEGLTRELCGTCAIALFLPTPQYSNETAKVR